MLPSVHELSNRGELLDATPVTVTEYLLANRREEVFLLKTSPPAAHVEVLWLGREEEADINQLFQTDDGLIAAPFVWEPEFLVDESGAIALGGAY